MRKFQVVSQNRSFNNRIGKGKVSLTNLTRLYLPNRIGSIGHLASAATVAASSFNIRVTDPHKLLRSIDLRTWNGPREVKPVQEDDE